MQGLHADVEELQAVRRVEDVVRARLKDQKRDLPDEVRRVHPALVPVHHVVPENLRLRDSKEVVCGPEKRRRGVVVERDHARSMDALAEHPIPLRPHVIGLKRIGGVVVAGRHADRIDHDEAERSALHQLGRGVIDAERKFSLLFAGIDKDEGAAHVPGDCCGLVKEHPEVILFLLKLLKLVHLLAIVGAGDLDPLARDVVGDGLHAGADHAILSDLL